MRQEVLNEMIRIADRYAPDSELNGLMKRFIQEKAAENSIWSDITINSCRMLGGDASPALITAAALTELILLTLDIVDDLQDRDKEDKPWMRCPEAFTLNAVLAFMAGMMGEMASLQQYSYADLPLAAEVSQLLARSINGQQKDLGHRLETEADYIAMVQEKSGSLLRLACCMGYSFVDNCRKEIMERMDELADCVGIVAQIENDLNDLNRFDLRNDLLQKKRTLPILYMLMHCEEEFPVLKQFYEGLIEQDAFLKHKAACVNYMDRCGCIEYTRVIQSLYLERAEQLLEELPASPFWKDQWRELTLAPFAGCLNG